MKMNHKISTPNAPKSVGPYSLGVLSNNIYFISGQIAIDPERNVFLSSDISGETKQIMDNISQILQNLKATFSHIIKCEIFLTDMGNYDKFNEVYASYFAIDDFPARQVIGVNSLPKNAKVEISLIISKPL